MARKQLRTFHGPLACATCRGYITELGTCLCQEARDPKRVRREMKARGYTR